MRLMSLHRPRGAAMLALIIASACADPAPPQRPDPGVAVRVIDPQVRPDKAVPTARGQPAAPDSADSAVARPTAAVRSAGPGRARRRIVFGYMDFTGVGHDRGNPAAPVVVINLSDFGCPYCGEFARDVYPAIDREYVQTGKVLFKYIPFIAGSFPHAAEATRAAECAAEQGQFWRMADLLYETQAEWKSGGRAVDAQMSALAETLPIDRTRYSSCYADRRTDVRTARGTAVADQIGVRVTPSFLVNGKPLQGALPLAEFRKQIEIALLLEASKRGAPGKPVR